MLRGIEEIKLFALQPSVTGFILAERLDEILVASDPSLRPEIAEADSRAATVKQRPTSRRITPAEINVRNCTYSYLYLFSSCILYSQCIY